MLSSTNSLRRDKYVFQPKRYDDNGNLICVLSKRITYKNGKKFIKKDKCKLTGVYDFEKEEFIITWVAEGFMNASHKKLLNYFLKKYEYK